jgi:hypothetical protein
MDAHAAQLRHQIDATRAAMDARPTQLAQRVSQLPTVQLKRQVLGPTRGAQETAAWATTRLRVARLGGAGLRGFGLAWLVRCEGATPQRLWAHAHLASARMRRGGGVHVVPGHRSRGVASRQHGVGRFRGGHRTLEGSPDHTGHCDPGFV